MPFEEMPPFDLEEELCIDSLNEDGLRGSYRFAYKFMTDFNRSNSGYSFTLPDGTKVWRLGIHSPGALSQNVLFTEFEIPEGACLFLYNPDQTHVLGSFTHRNNTDLRLFPVSPVEGDRLIIEYREPADVDFPGRLTVGEVNHAYRSLRREPAGNLSGYSCMEPPACFTDDPLVTEELSRSTVLLIIDGIYACTGVMVNNANHDGTPYVLTASHCINKDFAVSDREQYDVIAGSIVTFFNYNSPLCSTVLRGAEEMSMSSATLKAVNENVDMALLELMEIPPVYYQPYYAGWNIAAQPSAPYFGIHHPRASVKRISWLDDGLKYGTFNIAAYPFFKEAHWNITEWTAGSTDAGSSGSPLFDGEGRVIGALSGGYSTCKTPKDDYFYALNKAWDPLDKSGNAEPDDRRLSHWLNPSSADITTCDGLDPYASTASCVRLSNIGALADSIALDTIPGTPIPLYGNNEYEIFNYAEAYHTTGDALLHGVYIVSPAAGRNFADLQVEIEVYGGEKAPQTLLHSQTFRPKYVEYADGGVRFFEQDKSLDRAQESFLAFDSTITVKGNFYVGYRIVSAPPNTFFAAYNLRESSTPRNTAWMLAGKKWIEATSHPEVPRRTSLFIDPVVEYVSKPGNIPLGNHPGATITLSADRRTAYVHLPEGKKESTLTLISITGQVLHTSRLQPGQTAVALPPTSPGVYLLKLSGKDMEVIRKVVL
jgi:hypothetical protein